MPDELFMCRFLLKAKSDVLGGVFFCILFIKLVYLFTKFCIKNN